MGMKGAGKLCAPHRTKGRLDTHVKRARARRNREAPAPQAAVPPPPPALPVPVGAGAGNPFDVLQVQVAPGSPQEPIFVLVDAAQHIVACLQRKHHADSKLLNCLDAKLLLSSAVPPPPAPPQAGGTGVTVGSSESAPTTRGGPGGGASGSRRGGFATEAASGGDDFEDSIMMEDSGGPRGGGSGSARPSPWVPEVPPGSSRLGTRLGAARGTVTASGKPGEGREERPAECLLGGGDTSIQVHDARLLHPPPPIHHHWCQVLLPAAPRSLPVRLTGPGRRTHWQTPIRSHWHRWLQQTPSACTRVWRLCTRPWPLSS